MLFQTKTRQTPPPWLSSHSLHPLSQSGVLINRNNQHQSFFKSIACILFHKIEAHVKRKSWLLTGFRIISTTFPSPKRSLATRILKNVNSFSRPPFTREQKKLYLDHADSSKEMTCASEIFHKEAAFTKYQDFQILSKNCVGWANIAWRMLIEPIDQGKPQQKVLIDTFQTHWDVLRAETQQHTLVSIIVEFPASPFMETGKKDKTWQISHNKTRCERQRQGCIFRLTCSYPELTSQVLMLKFLEPSREMP